MTNNERSRLFFALTAEGLGERLRPVHERLAGFPRAVKAVSPENYHITLKFLGETEADTLRRIRLEFRDLQFGVPAQSFTLRGLGAFPGMRKPQVLWCGLDCDLGAILRIQGMIEDLSEKHGFKREARRFQPHLTLGRIRREMAMPQALAEYFASHHDTVFGGSRFDRVVLFKSELRKEGPEYAAMEELTLP
jgi:2'-5' RNA ligase